MNDYLVVTTSSPEQTAEVQDILRQHDIRSYAQTDATSEGLEALVGGSPFGNKIYVNEEDFEQARSLVDAYFKEHA